MIHFNYGNFKYTYSKYSQILRHALVIRDVFFTFYQYNGALYLLYALLLMDAPFAHAGKNSLIIQLLTTFPISFVVFQCFAAIHSLIVAIALKWLFRSDKRITLRIFLHLIILLHYSLTMTRTAEFALQLDHLMPLWLIWVLVPIIFITLYLYLLKTIYQKMLQRVPKTS